MKEARNIQGISVFATLIVACGLYLAAAAPARAQDDASYRNSDDAQASDRDDDARKAAQHRRAAVSTRGGREFDPRVYEARGRELQGEYYEITTMANPPAWASRNSESGESSEKIAPQGKHGFWVWAAAIGAAGAAGAVGFYLLDHKAASQPRDVEIALTDKP